MVDPVVLFVAAVLSVVEMDVVVFVCAAVFVFFFYRPFQAIAN